MRIYLLLILSLFAFSSCTNTKNNTSILYYNGTIHTVAEQGANTECMIIDQGQIIAVGSYSDLSKMPYKEKVDLHKKHVYPGFIDAHCHFYYYGLGLNELNLKGCKSFEEVIAKVIEHGKSHTEGWLVGRGWDHTMWESNTFPNNKTLDSLFPNRPVLLKRIDGHAALVNSAAFKEAGITSSTQIPGGEIVVKDAKLTGIVIDNAVDKIFDKVPPPTTNQQINGLMQAQENCFAAGLTTVVCAGLDYEVVELMDSLHKSGDLKMHIYAMLNPKTKNFDWAKSFAGKPFKTGKLNVQSFKLYADGSLGSRGALLKEEYCDKKGHFGLPVLSYAQLDSFAEIVYHLNYQVNTHCIGDSANAMMLNLYGKYLKQENDRRWRIEHAQVVDTSDLSLFTKYSIIPSVQPTHATSDMRWAEERVCSHRMPGAYAYKKLLQTNGILPLGTDFPVENIYPLETYFAAVFRSKDESEPFQIEDGLTPWDALRGMTTWAAYSCFEENEKGSLKPGMKANFVLLSDDLETQTKENFTNLRVESTFIDGNEVFVLK